MFNWGRSPQKLEATCVGASSEKDDDNCGDMALTDNIDETWQSGQHAPQYIDIKLDKKSDISTLKLLPYQVPTPAETEHKIYVGPSLDSLQLATEVKGETTHHRWLEVPVQAKDTQYVRIETVKSPSWVAWSGIQVLGK